MTISTHEYIGIPYISKGRDRNGCDCWGLVRLVYREQLGIELPSYNDDYADAAEREEVALAIAAGRAGWKMVEVPQPGDVISLIIRTEPTHVGIYAGDGFFLNVRKGANACLERVEAPFWKRRIAGYYRHDH